MRDSDTYMAILEEGHKEGHEKGRIEELNRMILRLGQKSFGPADESVKIFLAGIEDLDRLEFLHERILDVKSWQEWLAAV